MKNKKTIAIISAMLLLNTASWASEKSSQQKIRISETEATELRTVTTAETNAGTDNKPVAVMEQKKAKPSPVLTLLKIHGI